MSLKFKERLVLNLEVINIEMMFKTMRTHSITEGEVEPSKLLH